MGFVMVLSWSRQIFLRFFLGAHMENFLRGHVGAFAAWGGVPRTLLYDNLKAPSLSGRVRLFASIRCYWVLPVITVTNPDTVAVARGNEKGRVERAIRYIRDNFSLAAHLPI